MMNEAAMFVEYINAQRDEGGDTSNHEGDKVVYASTTSDGRAGCIVMFVFLC